MAERSLAPRKGTCDRAAGLYLRHLRRSKGLSPEQLGAMAGVSGGSIRSYENRGVIPWDSTQKRLARVFPGHEPDDIWTVQRVLTTRVRGKAA